MLYKVIECHFMQDMDFYRDKMFRMLLAFEK